MYFRNPAPQTTNFSLIQNSKPRVYDTGWELHGRAQQLNFNKPKIRNPNIIYIRTQTSYILEIIIVIIVTILITVIISLFDTGFFHMIIFCQSSSRRVPEKIVFPLLFTFQVISNIFNKLLIYIQYMRDTRENEIYLLIQSLFLVPLERQGSSLRCGRQRLKVQETTALGRVM